MNNKINMLKVHSLDCGSFTVGANGKSYEICGYTGAGPFQEFLYGCSTYPREGKGYKFKDLDNASDEGCYSPVVGNSGKVLITHEQYCRKLNKDLAALVAEHGFNALLQELEDNS